MRNSKNLFPLALRGTLRRGRQTMLIFVILMLSVAFAVVAMSYSGSILKTNTENRLNTYGAWDGALLQRFDGDIEYLESKEYIEQIGTTSSVGMVVRNSSEGYSDYYLGCIDDEYAEIGRVRTVSGRLPKDNSEVAVSEGLLNYLGIEHKLGQTVNLKVYFSYTDENDDFHYFTIQTDFTLCGILYDTVWDSGGYLNSAIVTREAAESIYQKAEIQAGQSLGGISNAVYFTVSEGYENKMLTEFYRYFAQNGVSRDVVTNSSNTIDNGEADINTVYIVAILLVTLLAVLIVYALQMNVEIKRITRFRSIGATKGQLRLLILFETAFVCVPAILCGIGLGAFGTLLMLKLSVFAGSTEIFIDIPWNILIISASLWVLGVLIIKFATVQIAIATPLAGRMGATPKKQKIMRRLQKVLIVAVSITFGTVIILSTIGLSENISTYNYYNNHYWYHVYESELFVNTMHTFFTDEMTEEITSVEGIKEVRGYTVFKVSLSSDDIEKTAVTMYAIDGEQWTSSIDFTGVDFDSFNSGASVVLSFPEDYDGVIPNVGDKVTITVKSYSTERVDTIDFDVTVAGINIDNVTKATYTLDLGSPYTVICSKGFMQYVISNLPENYYWSESNNAVKKGYLAGTENATFAHILVFAERGSDYNIADSYVNWLTSMKRYDSYALDSPYHVSLYSESVRVEVTSKAQFYLQTVILLLLCGGCIGVVTLIILSSTIRLETQREKRRYGILQAIGMSRCQRNLRLAGTALIRAVIAVAAGWGVYILSLVYTNREAISEGQYALTVISDYIANIAKYYMSPAAMGIMTAALFIIVFVICYVSKLGLNRFSLMELLRED